MQDFSRPDRAGFFDLPRQPDCLRRSFFLTLETTGEEDGMRLSGGIFQDLHHPGHPGWKVRIVEMILDHALEGASHHNAV